MQFFGGASTDKDSPVHLLEKTGNTAVQSSEKNDEKLTPEYGYTPIIFIAKVECISAYKGYVTSNNEIENLNVGNL
ncbi:UNVERIFIED_CONTAM: hypothetical protein Sindi_0527100 [Sesamum indicum]